MGDAVKQPENKTGIGHKIVTVLGVILCLVFIPIIILNMILIIRSYTDPDHLPMVFGFSPVIVMSGSMNPEFYTGDMILLQKTDPDTLEVGDVVCYFAEGDKEAAVTHRIVEIQNQDGQRVFIMRGDANSSEDRIGVTPDMIQGKYTGVCFVGVGNIAVFLQSPMGMIICIVCPLVLFVLWDAVRRMIASRKRAGKSNEMQEELERLRAQVAQQENKSLSGAAEEDDGAGNPPA